METIGQRFKNAREKKRVSLSQAALKTHIKVQNLEMMERGDFTKMPAPIYARGFIRSYAGYLGLDAAPLVKEYDEQLGGDRRPPAPPITSKIIATAPGEQPLPTATVTDLAAELPPSQQPGSDGPTAPIITAQTLAIAGLVVGVILLIVAVIKFWPAGTAGERAPRATVVEVQRPVERSSDAITREPPEPFVEIQNGGRAP